MSRISLNKTQWSKIQPHLSGRAATGRPPADDKRTLEAILFVLTTGCRWRDLPSEYDGYVTAWRRHRRWTQDGTFARTPASAHPCRGSRRRGGRRGRGDRGSVRFPNTQNPRTAAMLSPGFLLFWYSSQSLGAPSWCSALKNAPFHSLLHPESNSSQLPAYQTSDKFEHPSNAPARISFVALPSMTVRKE